MRSLLTAIAVCSMLGLGACQSSGQADHADHAGHDHKDACCGTCSTDGAKACCGTCSTDGAKACCGTCGGDGEAAKKACPITCTKDCCAAKAK